MHTFIDATLLLGLVLSSQVQGAAKEPSPFVYTIDKDAETGWTVITMSYNNPDDRKNNISIKITPEGGNNMFSFIIGEQELIAAPEKLSGLFERCWGNPLLFPTPNRIRNSTYEFLGQTYKMSFPGETRSHMCHGIAWDDTAWKYEKPEIKKDRIVLKTYYVLDEKNPRFPAYPFKNTLTVQYELLKDRVKISYLVENQDTKPLGFGFALHPFWNVIGGKENTRIQVETPYHMEATSELLPTGKTEKVDNTKYDLMKPVPVSQLRLDDVFLGATPESNVRVIYDKIGLEIIQKATADFTHVVVYTPDKEFFCIENQTCSTDAHNLYAKGLVKESHLQILDPGKKTGGTVEYIPKWFAK